MHIMEEALRYDISLWTGNLNASENNMEAAGINLNTTARDEHVPEIERYI